MITANTTVIIIVNTRPITPIDKVGMDKVIAAKINVEALATAKEALIEGTAKDK